MNKKAAILICAFLIFALTVPVFAGKKPTKRSAARNVAGSVYNCGASALSQTEDALNECLVRTFSFFNPCLDLIKGASNLVVAPIEGPINYFSRTKAIPKKRKAKSK
jgi:hypothetical protein